MTKRPKPDTPSALRLLEPARKTREAMQDHNADFAPMVLFAPRHGQPKIAICDGEGELKEELDVVLADMRLRMGPAEWIAVTTDAFVQRTDKPVDIVPGQLATAFEKGATDVIEQMIVVLRHRYQPSEMAAQTYRWIPSEGWEWDQPELYTNYGGPIVQVLDRYM